MGWAPCEWDQCLFRKTQGTSSTPLFFFQLTWTQGEDGPCTDIRCVTWILGLLPCWAMRNTCFISLPFSDTLQPWPTMTWAATCPLSFISLKGDQASFQLRLLTMPQHDEGVHSVTSPSNEITMSQTWTLWKFHLLCDSQKEIPIKRQLSWFHHKSKSLVPWETPRPEHFRLHSQHNTAQPATDWADLKRWNRKKTGCSRES